MSGWCVKCVCAHLYNGFGWMDGKSIYYDRRVYFVFTNKYGCIHYIQSAALLTKQTNRRAFHTPQPVCVSVCIERTRTCQELSVRFARTARARLASDGWTVDADGGRERSRCNSDVNETNTAHARARTGHAETARDRKRKRNAMGKLERARARANK